MNSDSVAKQMGSLASAAQNLGEAFAKFEEELTKTICDICEMPTDTLEIAKRAADAEINEEKREKNALDGREKRIFSKNTQRQC